jgi:hypothetical protein
VRVVYDRKADALVPALADGPLIRVNEVVNKASAGLTDDPVSYEQRGEIEHVGFRFGTWL